MDDRLPWVDNCKAICIMFVLLGHTSGITPLLSKYIYSFHIPLFFFLSGTLIKPERLEANFGKYFKKYLVRLMIPYLFFSALSYVAWVLVLRHFGANARATIPVWKPLVGIFYGNGINNWMQHNVPLWFLPCLFVTHMIFYGMCRLRRRAHLITALVTIAVFGFLDAKFSPLRLPWGADIALTAVVFLGIGYVAKPYLARWQHIKPPTRLLCSALFLTVQFVCLVLNNHVKMNNGMYGNPGYFYGAAFSGILFWVGLMQFLDRNRVLMEVSKNTMVFFAMHAMAFPAITAFCVYVLGLPLSFKEHAPVVAFAYVIVSLVLLTPAALMLRIHCPWALGKERTEGNNAKS